MITIIFSLLALSTPILANGLPASKCTHEADPRSLPGMSLDYLKPSSLAPHCPQETEGSLLLTGPTGPPWQSPCPEQGLLGHHNQQTHSCLLLQGGYKAKHVG